MEAAPRGLTRFMLETVHSREEARERLAYWRDRARSVPGAEVRALTIPDPIGGVTVMLYSKNADLIPPEVRLRQDQEARERLGTLRQNGPEEDRDAVEAARRSLKRALGSLVSIEGDAVTVDFEAMERWYDEYERQHPPGQSGEL